MLKQTSSLESTTYKMIEGHSHSYLTEVGSFVFFAS